MYQRAREQKKGDADGTRAPVKANGLPVKPPKPTSIVKQPPLRAIPWAYNNDT